MKKGYPYLKNSFGNFNLFTAFLEKRNKPFRGSLTRQFPVEIFIKNDANALPKYLIFGISPTMPLLQNLSHFIKSNLSLEAMSINFKTSFLISIFC